MIYGFEEHLKEAQSQETLWSGVFSDSLQQNDVLLSKANEEIKDGDDIKE